MLNDIETRTCRVYPWPYLNSIFFFLQQKLDLSVLPSGLMKKIQPCNFQIKASKGHLNCSAIFLPDSEKCGLKLKLKETNIRSENGAFDF